MSQALVAGQNCPIPQDVLQVVVSTGASADVSTFRLYSDGKTRQDDDFIFYGQNTNADTTIAFAQSANVTTFTVDLQRMKADAEKIAFCVTTDAASITALQYINLEIFQAGTSLLTCTIDLQSRAELALILGEIYKRNGAWKFRCVAQGFNGGLKPLAEFYGVDIASDAAPTPPPAPAPTPAPTINLSKVTLTKESPRIDLKKQASHSGLFKVNLNWNKGTSVGESKKTGLLGGLFNRGKSSGGIDLDLAAYFCLKNGSQGLIQALGNKFGSLQDEPYLQLQGDDRTGSQSDGEWMHINGQKFDKIEEILIFTFIYEGVPNWNATDAIVTIHIPGQAEIQTSLTEGSSTLPMCAIAKISNHGGDVRIERINRYFRGHKEMDEAFGWGFNWVAGSK